MPDRKITCVTKPDRQSPHEHITHAGNSSEGWILTRAEIIRKIDGNIDTFYVIDPRNGKRADVGVVRPNDGRNPYIRTHADGYYNDNLLSLDPCIFPRY